MKIDCKTCQSMWKRVEIINCRVNCERMIYVILCVELSVSGDCCIRYSTVVLWAIYKENAFWKQRAKERRSNVFWQITFSHFVQVWHRSYTTRAWCCVNHRSTYSLFNSLFRLEQRKHQTPAADPLWGESTGDLWIFLTKDKLCRWWFRVM